MVRAVSLGILILFTTEAFAASIETKERAVHRSRSGGSATADAIKAPIENRQIKKTEPRARFAPDMVKSEDAMSADSKKTERKIPLSRSGGSASKTYNIKPADK